MASYNPNNLSDDELCCPICFEEYSSVLNCERVPKLLMCLHTFCLACVRSLVQSNKMVQCSICRTEHTDVTPNDLYDNYVILDYVRKQQEESDAKFARQQAEQMTADNVQITSSQILQDQVCSDAEVARKFQQYYDKGGEDTADVPEPIEPPEISIAEPHISVRTGHVVQPAEVLSMAQEEQVRPNLRARLSYKKAHVLPIKQQRVCSASNSASSSLGTNGSSSSSSQSTGATSSTYTSNTSSTYTSDTCSDGRCSSRASSSSRLEDEFVDSVESLESGPCYSGHLPPATVAADDGSSNGAHAVTGGGAVAGPSDTDVAGITFVLRPSVIHMPSATGSSSSAATDCTELGMSSTAALPANFTNTSGFSCSTYEVEDFSDHESLDDRDAIETSDMEGDNDIDEEASMDDNMHLLETFTEADTEDGRIEAAEEEAQGERSIPEPEDLDELFINFDALEEASVDSEMFGQSNQNVYIVDDDSNSSYNSEGSMSPNNVDVSVRSGYVAPQQRSATTFLLGSDDDTESVTENFVRDDRDDRLPSIPMARKRGASVLSQNSLMDSFDPSMDSSSDDIDDTSHSTITLDD